MPIHLENPEHTGRLIEVEVVTRASAGRIWEAWTDPERMVEWFADRVGGSMLPSGTVTWGFDRLQTEMSFRVVVAAAPERLVLQSVAEVSTRLEILIGAARDATRIRLIHSGFPETAEWNDDFSAISSGWRIALAVLCYYAEFHFGHPRTDFFVCRPARFQLARLQPLYRDPSGLQEWLTDGGSLGAPGGRVYLALKGGEELRGDMLADTGTEVAMGWDEIAGVLQLKTFPLPQEPGLRALCVLGWGWGLSLERAHRIEREMTEAVERLEKALERTPVLGAVSVENASGQHP